MRALHDIVKAGYVRYIGMSSCWAWQFHAMQSGSIRSHTSPSRVGRTLILCKDYAIANNLTPFVNCQNFYNLLYREEEREMMPLLKYLGVGSTPWSPMAKGRTLSPIVLINSSC